MNRSVIRSEILVRRNSTYISIISPLFRRSELRRGLKLNRLVLFAPYDVRWKFSCNHLLDRILYFVENIYFGNDVCLEN